MNKQSQRHSIAYAVEDMLRLHADGVMDVVVHIEEAVEKE